MEELGIAVTEGLISAIRAYIFAGIVFSIPFVLLGIQRVDPDARGWGVGFRFVIFPGLCVFWPLFATRLLRGKQRPVERNAHRVAAQVSTGREG